MARRVVAALVCLALIQGVGACAQGQIEDPPEDSGPGNPLKDDVGPDDDLGPPVEEMDVPEGNRPDAGGKDDVAIGLKDLEPPRDLGDPGPRDTGVTPPRDLGSAPVDTGNGPADCGRIARSCCPGSRCGTGLQCANGLCVERPTCGSIDLMCCGVAACGPGLSCMSSRCTASGPCGGSGQACCGPPTPCVGSLACVNTTCVPCGNLGQACCTTAPTCFGSMRCTSGYCVD